MHAYIQTYHECDIDSNKVVGFDGHGGAIHCPILQRRAVVRYDRHAVLISVKRQERLRPIDRDLLAVHSPTSPHHHAPPVAWGNAVDGLHHCPEIPRAVLPNPDNLNVESSPPNLPTLGLIVSCQLDKSSCFVQSMHRASTARRESSSDGRRLWTWRLVPGILLTWSWALN